MLVHIYVQIDSHMNDKQKNIFFKHTSYKVKFKNTTFTYCIFNYNLIVDRNIEQNIINHTLCIMLKIHVNMHTELLLVYNWQCSTKYVINNILFNIAINDKIVIKDAICKSSIFEFYFVACLFEKYIFLFVIHM